MAVTITNFLIILLLAGAIGYGYLISLRVQRLMIILKSLEPMVVEFSKAVDKSEESVSRMRENLETAEHKKTEAAPEVQEEKAASLQWPKFASRRERPDRQIGTQMVRDKQDLVRMFFEATRSESSA